MTSAGQEILQLPQQTAWIAFGVFASGPSLAAAVTELISGGVPAAAICLAATPATIERVAAVPKVRNLGPLRALLDSAAEAKLPSCHVPIFVAPACTGKSFLSPDMAQRLCTHIADGCILLGATAESAGDAARTCRILLRYSSQHVHMIQSSRVASEQQPST
jgi:hypothetical protein